MVIGEMYVILRPCMMALSDHAILSNLGGFELNNLISILDIEDNEPQIIQHQIKSNQVYLYTAYFENDSGVFTVRKQYKNKNKK